MSTSAARAVGEREEATSRSLGQIVELGFGGKGTSVRP